MSKMGSHKSVSIHVMTRTNKFLEDLVNAKDKVETTTAESYNSNEKSSSIIVQAVTRRNSKALKVKISLIRLITSLDQLDTDKIGETPVKGIFLYRPYHRCFLQIKGRSK